MESAKEPWWNSERCELEEGLEGGECSKVEEVEKVKHLWIHVVLTHSTYTYVYTVPSYDREYFNKSEHNMSLW